jgi:hypothetical protein
VTGEIDKDYDTNELRAILMSNGLESTGKADALKNRCRNANLPLKRKIPNLKQGYIGRVKGAKQIAFERGFFDESCKIDGVLVSWEGDLIKDAQGRQVLDRYGSKARNTQRSVRRMLAGCHDFINEKTFFNTSLKTNLIVFVC